MTKFLWNFSGEVSMNFCEFEYFCSYLDFCCFGMKSFSAWFSSTFFMLLKFYLNSYHNVLPISISWWSKYFPAFWEVFLDRFGLRWRVKVGISFHALWKFFISSVFNDFQFFNFQIELFFFFFWSSSSS